MTLIKKVALVVLMMLLLVFMGTYFITMNNARNFFIQQIESNAQDTATSLGLSLSQSLLNHDEPAVNSMVQAVFDRGYFSFIQVKDIKGKILVTKKLMPQNDTIPEWFVRLIQWPMTKKSSLVMDGWMQAGEVAVISDPGNAYRALWRNAVVMIKAYFLFALIALLLTYGFIQLLMRPLKRVTAQALAISEHEFPIETQIPHTPELKQVTLAMNQMVLRIKSLFEDQLQQAELLRVQVYQDPLTGLNNRRYFLQQLAAILDNEDEFIPGYVLMIVIDGLDDLNHKQSYQQGDNLVLSIARLCNQFWRQHSVSSIARISGSTFALINHELDPELFDQQCKEFENLLRQAISEVKYIEVHMGATGYFAHQSVSNLLSMVDLSVKKAREQTVFFCQKEHDTFKYPRLITREDLLDCLNKKNMQLYSQEITNGKDSLHKEIFVRILDRNSSELGAGYFMPAAEKMELAHRIDQYVLNELTQKEYSAIECFALNISEDTLVHTEHRNAYLQQLKNTPASILKNLSLELSESKVLSSFEETKSFVKQVQKLGVKIGVDGVGIHFSPLHYLRELHVDYLKLHGSLVQDIDENESKQFFIYYFNEMAKTLDIKVVATQVEQEAQWHALELIHVSWGQGRYLEPVVPLI
ncbi:LapD/MoxY N-terminal periplasmic domain-containing protein [Legionella worsleiensis]|uniref:Two component histidine kinase n=1 Tax=Legionella worsleiensis TaxID=45076 RepID=A0A0W1A3J6_9GAMM|nr:LapD/MoxY N-terminal periplasmic domain-containing protein [Legionella worsleiensis]KTD75954.1 two component histidine kinase [Legionella worsleiensis]STY32967.1 two component histidine kinase, GGDEF domain protein/EAL domain protein [Legionella worsleiensis]